MNNDQQGDNRSITIGTSVADSTVVLGDGNTVTVTNTEIIQISVNEVKTRKLITTSPYKGLVPFEPDDSDRFFGRNQFLTKLLTELKQTTFILLLGASGSGKSSVVRAGLVPLLQKMWGTFERLMFTPDCDPFDSLYSGLRNCRYKQSEAEFAKDGKEDTLSQVVHRLKPPESKWLIFIDQFEELFTLSDPEKRDCFITSLVQLSQERANDPSVKIVATMRADFLDQLDPFPANLLADLTQQHRPLITQMQPDELRLAIEQPAAQHGVVFEIGLVEIIIKDLQGQAGYLPLLQYTLNLLWEEEVKRSEFSQERMLQTQTYLNLGGVRGALQRRVDQIYESLTEPEQNATQRIFLKLVEISGDDSTGTELKPVRRRAERSEFSDKTEQTVLTRLINANLLVSDGLDARSEQRKSAVRSATVEIAHEVLLTSWQTLSTWIEENRQAISLRNRLYDDVRLWLKEEKRDADLWNGVRLKRVNELRANATFEKALGGFHQEAIAFIEASNALGKRQMHERIAAGDHRRSAMMELLEACTVSLIIPDQEGVSTGFFVAPGKILTCAPKILKAEGQSIKVTWQDQGTLTVNEATIDRLFQTDNLAILKLTHEVDHPCVYLDTNFEVDDPICTYGYSTHVVKDGYSHGKCQKRTGKDRRIIEFITYQNSMELESSPLLNLKTLKVCGIVQSTHGQVKDMPDQDVVTVGKATSASTILATVNGLKKEQETFHKRDRRWSSLFPPRCKPRTVALASLGMAALVVLVRASQVFQPIELGFYDALMRNQINPPKPSDRFLIVTITKQDAEAQEARGEVMSYSLSNKTLIRLFQKIEAFKPIAVGLDIYREQTLNPSQSEARTLENLFKQSDLFAVCKGQDELEPDGIAPPPGVDAARVGFSDFSQDGDRILRRQLLAFRPSDASSSRCSSTKSFGLLIAERYLASQENTPVVVDTSNGCQITLNNRVVPNIQPNTGGYQGYAGKASDLFEGCQILLNYREQKEDQKYGYETVTLEKFLEKDFKPQNGNKRIVLIGIDRSDGISDNVRTPFDQDVDQVTPGVIVQAQMIDQIIDVATGDDSLIWVLPGKVDLLLILMFALAGGGLGWWIFSPRKLGVIVVLTGGSVLIISIVIFQLGGWVALMPHFLALSATSSYIFWCNVRLRSVSSTKSVKQSSTTLAKA